MTISKQPTTRIRANELSGMKLDRINGASWIELEEKYGYHRTTIMRAVRNEIKPGSAVGVKKNTRFTEMQAAHIDANGGCAYLRNLVDRDMVGGVGRG